MGLYLVRHAHAGRRGAWAGSDAERPLSDRGRRQVAGILELLPEELGSVLSSPAVRCVETVSDAAARAGTSPQLEDALFEGNPPALAERRLRKALRKHPGRHLVACSHGDLIPSLIEIWADAGAALDPGQHTAKGGTWVLDVDDEGRVTAGRYVPPVA